MIRKYLFQNNNHIPPLKNLRLIGSVYYINLKECGISTRAGMWEEGSVQRFIIFSAPQRREEKYVFQCFSFGNVKIFSIN
jgi:hypothetical protein